jgi:hypothetical protein
MGVRNPNSTGYIHPDEPNLLNIHKALAYDYTGQPHLRVTLGSDTITITGDVNIGTEVKINNTSANPLPIVGSVQSFIVNDLDIKSMPEVSVYTDSGNTLNIAGTVDQGGTWTVGLDAPSLAALENTTVTISGTPTVNIGTMPEVEIKNDAGNPITVTGSVTTIGGSAQGKLWTVQIAQGLIAGHTIEAVSGYNPATSAGDAVWSAATPYPWSSLVTAQTLYLKSSTNNATDRSMPILIDGLDANYANQTEVITLDASDSRTVITSTKQFLRIHYIMCNGANTNAGDITAHVTSGTGTIVSKLSAGRGRAQAGVYTIPAGYTGYLFKGDASSTAATVVNFMARYFGKAFMVVHVAIVDNSTYIYDFPFPMVLPEKTDMYTTIEAGSGKTAVNYELLLVANP